MRGCWKDVLAASDTISILVETFRLTRSYQIEYALAQASVRAVNFSTSRRKKMELTNAILKGSHLTCIVQDTQCTPITGDNKCQNHPPEDALCTKTISQMSEEENEGQLDRPQTSIREKVSGQLPTQVSHLDGGNVFWQVGVID